MKKKEGRKIRIWIFYSVFFVALKSCSMCCALVHVFPGLLSNTSNAPSQSCCCSKCKRNLITKNTQSFARKSLNWSRLPSHVAANIPSHTRRSKLNCSSSIPNSRINNILVQRTMYMCESIPRALRCIKRTWSVAFKVRVCFLFKAVIQSSCCIAAAFAKAADWDREEGALISSKKYIRV